MASVPVKHEFIAEYAAGMGLMLSIIVARDADEIIQRYPLFAVREIRASDLSEETLDHLRMYPAATSSADAAVAGSPLRVRQEFLRRRTRHLKKVERLRETSGTAGLATYLQTWVDIDDDAEFRVQMHELWKDDPRYLALPPEQRLF